MWYAKLLQQEQIVPSFVPGLSNKPTMTQQHSGYYEVPMPLITHSSPMLSFLSALNPPSDPCLNAIGTCHACNDALTKEGNISVRVHPCDGRPSLKTNTCNNAR
jgi:hypothetical protein